MQLKSKLSANFALPRGRSVGVKVSTPTLLHPSNEAPWKMLGEVLSTKVTKKAPEPKY